MDCRRRHPQAGGTGRQPHPAGDRGGRGKGRRRCGASVLAGQRKHTGLALERHTLVPGRRPQGLGSAWMAAAAAVGGAPGRPTPPPPMLSTHGPAATSGRAGRATDPARGTCGGCCAPRLPRESRIAGGSPRPLQATHSITCHKDRLQHLPPPPPPASAARRRAVGQGGTNNAPIQYMLAASGASGDMGAWGPRPCPRVVTGGGVWSRPRCGWGLCQVGSTVVQAVAASSGWLRTGSAPLLHEQEQPPGMDTQQQPSLRGVDAHAYLSNMTCSAPRRLAAGCASCGVPHDRFPARPASRDCRRLAGPADQSMVLSTQSHESQRCSIALLVTFPSPNEDDLYSSPESERRRPLFK